MLQPLPLGTAKQGWLLKMLEYNLDMNREHLSKRQHADSEIELVP